MGKRLINSITVNVNIQSANRTGGEANTYVNTNGIVEGASISLGQPMTDWALMEELIHVYQNINGGCYDAKLNKEVEAKLGWYAYMKRIGNLDDPSNVFGGPKGEYFYDKMYGFLLKEDMGNPNFIQAFGGAAEYLRNMDGYKNERFDPNKMGCANLLELLKVIVIIYKNVVMKRVVFCYRCCCLRLMCIPKIRMWMQHRHGRWNYIRSRF